MENNVMTIKELNNKVEIVGTVKENKMELKISKKGTEYMAGYLMVEVKEGERVHTHKIEILSFPGKNPEKPNTVFVGHQTVMREVTPGMRVRVDGAISSNKYKNKLGELKKFNQIKGVFISRLDEDSEEQDRCLADIEVYIQGTSDIMDETGLPTGAGRLEGLTIRWGNEVVELFNTYISPELYPMAQSVLFSGQTIPLRFKLNNYAVIKEEVVQEAPQTLFGEAPQTFDKVKKDYVNNYEIVGANNPLSVDAELNQEEVEEALRLIKVKEAEIMDTQANSMTPQTNLLGGTGGMLSTAKAEAPVGATTFDSDELPF